MACGCCASRSVSELLLRSDRVASLVTSSLILPHVKMNPVLTLADQYSSSRAGENVTQSRRLKAHSQSGSRWRLLHKHQWGERMPTPSLTSQGVLVSWSLLHQMPDCPPNPEWSCLVYKIHTDLLFPNTMAMTQRLTDSYLRYKTPTSHILFI